MEPATEHTEPVTSLDRPLPTTWEVPARERPAAPAPDAPDAGGPEQGFFLL